MKNKEKMQVKFCPKCKSIEIEMVAGGIFGLWGCEKCGYRGSIFPVKEIRLGELNKLKKAGKAK